jgi:hypothetical protein
LFGLFGALVGTFYATTVLKLKGWVHDFFHAPHDDHHEKGEHGDGEHAKEGHGPDAEKTPLIPKGDAAKETAGKSKLNPEPPLHQRLSKKVQKYICCVIPYEPHRALVAGVVAGGMAGGIGMFFPQVSTSSVSSHNLPDVCSLIGSFSRFCFRR